jgi:thioesterase domain-containing protein
LLVLLDSPSPPKAKALDSGTATSPNKPGALALWSDRFHRHLDYAAQLGLKEELYNIARKGKAVISYEITVRKTRLHRSLQLLLCRTYAALGLTLPARLRSLYILDIYHGAMAEYVPEKYPGPAAYIKCEKSSSDRQSTWERLITGGVEVHHVPGNHWAVLKQSDIHLWAEKLGRWLSRAQAAD